MSGSLGSSPDIRGDEPLTNGPVLGDVVLSPAWSCSARQGGLRVAPGSSGSRDLFVSESTTLEPGPSCHAGRPAGRSVNCSRRHKSKSREESAGATPASANDSGEFCTAM